MSFNLEEKIHKQSSLNHPKYPELGTRTILFGRELFIDRSDFEINPPEGFFRLFPGGSVRLKYGFIVDFEDVILDPSGAIKEVYVRYDPATRSGQDNSGRRVKGTVHWVHAEASFTADIRLYDRLFSVSDPGSYDKPGSVVNPESLVSTGALVEPSLNELMPNAYFQFERVGFFKQDPDSRPDHMVYNRSVTLKDTWARKK